MSYGYLIFVFTILPTFIDTLIELLKTRFHPNKQTIMFYGPQKTLLGHIWQPNSHGLSIGFPQGHSIRPVEILDFF